MASDDRDTSPRPTADDEDEDDVILDAEADMESASEAAPGGQYIPSLIGEMTEEEAKEAARQSRLGSTSIFRTLIDFVKPGVAGQRVNPLKRRDHRIACPHCGAILTVPKQAIGRNILCLECESLIEHSEELVVQSIQESMSGSSPGETIPSLHTLDIGEGARDHAEEPAEDAPAVAPEAKKEWKDWDAVRKTKRGGRPAAPGSRGKAARPRDAQARTRAALERFREKTGLTEKDPMPYVGRPAGPTPLLARPAVVLGLLAVVAVGAAGTTALVVGGGSGGESAQPGPSDPTDTPPPPPPPKAREIAYAGFVPAGTEISVHGDGVGCTILTRDRVKIWLLVRGAELESIRKALDDPRAKVTIKGRGLLHSVRDPAAARLVPAGVDVEYVLEDGPAAIEFIPYDEYLRTSTELPREGRR